MISREVEVLLHRSFVSAREAKHASITVEHLVLEMLREAAIVAHLGDCGIGVEEMRTYLESKVSATARAGESDGEDFDTQPTPDFQRVIQRAILGVQKQHRAEVTPFDVLTAVLEHKNSLAALWLLEASARLSTTARLHNQPKKSDDLGNCPP